MKGGPKSSLRPFLHRALQLEESVLMLASDVCSKLISLYRFCEYIN